MNPLRRFLDRLRGILPAPDPRCVITNWGLRWGRPWRIVR
jgi:hypothetical protein